MIKDKQVNEFARKHGYEKAEYLKKWKGYRCYEPIMSKGKISFSGLPLLILVKGDEIRMSTPEEAMEI